MCTLHKVRLLTHVDKYMCMRRFRYISIYDLIYVLPRRKIRLVEGNAKRRHKKNWPAKGLCGRCLSVLGLEPHTLPPYTLYTCIQYTYSHGEGGGGRVEPERRREGQQFTNLGRKYQHDCLYFQSINTCRKVPLQVIFFDDNILL